MEIGDILTVVLNIVFTGAVGIISYFVKRTIDRQDKCVTKDEIKHYIDTISECKSDIKNVQEEKTTYVR